MAQLTVINGITPKTEVAYHETIPLTIIDRVYIYIHILTMSIKDVFFLRAVTVGVEASCFFFRPFAQPQR
jgi:hypothetical protein